MLQLKCVHAATEGVLCCALVISWRLTHADMCCCWTCAGCADSPAIRSHCRHTRTTGTPLCCCCSRSWESWWSLITEEDRSHIRGATLQAFIATFPSDRGFSFAAHSSIESKMLSARTLLAPRRSSVTNVRALDVDNCRYTKLLFEKHSMGDKRK